MALPPVQALLQRRNRAGLGRAPRGLVAAKGADDDLAHERDGVAGHDAGQVVDALEADGARRQPQRRPVGLGHDHLEGQRGAGRVPQQHVLAGAEAVLALQPRQRRAHVGQVVRVPRRPELVRRRVRRVLREPRVRRQPVVDRREAGDAAARDDGPRLLRPHDPVDGRDEGGELAPRVAPCAAVDVSERVLSACFA